MTARGIFARLALPIGVAFVLGYLALLTTAAGAILWPDDRPAIFRLVSPGGTASIAQAIEDAPERERPLIVAALNSDSLIVRLQDEFADDRPQNGSDAPYLEKLYGEYAAQLGGRPFVVQVQREPALRGILLGRIHAPGAIRMLVRLRTGRVLVIERAPVILQRLSARFIFIAGTGAAILAFVMFYSFGQIRRAISSLIAERTRVLAAITHDLRTYLTRLRLRADYISDTTQQRSATRDLDEMTMLLDDTLILARDETMRSERAGTTVDVRAELAAFVATRQEIGDVVRVSELLPEALEARCAPLALRRILANLTDNALRYGNAAYLGAVRERNVISITVDDDGPGVPPEAFTRLIEPFERLESSRGRQTGGAGLGLAIVKALAKSHGGDLVIANRVEGGLRARVRLPAL